MHKNKNNKRKHQYLIVAFIAIVFLYSLAIGEEKKNYDILVGYNSGLGFYNWQSGMIFPGSDIGLLNRLFLEYNFFNGYYSVVFSMENRNVIYIYQSPILTNIKLFPVGCDFIYYEPNNWHVGIGFRYNMIFFRGNRTIFKNEGWKEYDLVYFEEYLDSYSLNFIIGKNIKITNKIFFNFDLNYNLEISDRIVGRHGNINYKEYGFSGLLFYIGLKYKL